MRILKSIIKFLLLIFLSWSQTKAQVLEKRVRDWKPSEVFVSADVVGLGRLISNDIQYEIQAKVDFDQFYLGLDWGRSHLNSSGDLFEYKSRGNFFRLGPQVNFTPYNKSRSSIYFAFMYAHATFSDRIDYTLSDDIWGESNFNFENRRIRANWLEAAFGLNARITGPLYLGYIVRFKLAKRLTGDEILTPYEIPGFGEASKNIVFGFNYYITYRFSWRNKPIPNKPRIVKSNEKKEEGRSQEPPRNP